MRRAKAEDIDDVPLNRYGCYTWMSSEDYAEMANEDAPDLHQTKKRFSHGKSAKSTVTVIYRKCEF